MITYMEYNDDSENSHKFYRVIVEGNTVTTQWGRIGSSLNENKEVYPSLPLAKTSAEAIVEKKLKKGYKLIESDSEVIQHVSSLREDHFNIGE